jgi:rhamnosyltransferase subunit B
MSLEVLLLPLGSTGDVLPFCGLGRALRARGHRVAVAANAHFAPLVKSAGLTLVPLGDEKEYLALLERPEFMSRVHGFREVMRYVARLIPSTYELIAAQKNATVIAHPLAFAARVAEERLGVRTATVLLSPAILQSEHRPPVLPGVPNAPFLPRLYKRSVWWAADRLILDPMIAPALNAFRAARGLVPIRRVFSDGWRSPHLFLALYPGWFAPRQPDGPRNLVMTGFPLYDANGAAPFEEAERFLDDGSPPLVFTPGTGNRHARDFFRAAVEAAGILGRRALLLTRFGEQLPSPLPRFARHFSYLPLSRILPRSAALVHHGGIGSSAAALAAGVPQALMPFSHDQPDNAARLERLGVAAQLSPRRFRGRALAASLDRLLSSAETAARCRALAAQVRASRPLDDAALAIERYAGERLRARVLA